jgi:hypothetical protein
MADRTSASIFGQIFDLLAKNPTDEHKEMAKQIWPLRREYDFNDYQMDCDEALVKLDLAKLEGEEIIYSD